MSFSMPMECLAVKKLPTGEQWTYEIKLDGFHVEAIRAQDRVILYSKQGKLLTSQFMQIARELEKLPHGTALDGELSQSIRLECHASTSFRTTAGIQRISCTSPS